MKFDELKPGMFLVPTTAASRTWILIKRKQGGTVTIDDYWMGASGRFHITYDRGIIRKSMWDGSLRRSYILAATKDAQNLIITLFEQA